MQKAWRYQGIFLKDGLPQFLRLPAITRDLVLVRQEQRVCCTKASRVVNRMFTDLNKLAVIGYFSFYLSPDQIRGPAPDKFAAIECGNPDPSQRLPDRFRLAPWVLTEGIDESVGIETIERHCDRASINVWD